MTLQTSGAISLANIQTEFGGSNPISMSEYYAGGSYVPSGTSGTNGAVPTSGGISMSKFYGTSDYLDFQTMTAVNGDSANYIGDPIYDYDYTLQHGYIMNSIGSISPGTSNLYANSSWFMAVWEEAYGVYGNNPGQITFSLRRPMSSGAFSNSGWTTLTVVSSVAGTTNFSRTSLNFFTGNDGTYYYAYWITPPGTGYPDPFQNGYYGADTVTGITLKLT